MKMDSFIRAHIHMYGFFGGVATRLVCDNLKTGVVSHPREGEVVLTADYEALGSHYQTAIMLAGIRKPKHYRRKNVIGNLSLNKRYNRILRLNCCLRLPIII